MEKWIDENGARWWYIRFGARVFCIFNEKWCHFLTHRKKVMYFLCVTVEFNANTVINVWRLFALDMVTVFPIFHKEILLQIYRRHANEKRCSVSWHENCLVVLMHMIHVTIMLYNWANAKQTLMLSLNKIAFTMSWRELKCSVSIGAERWTYKFSMHLIAHRVIQEKQHGKSDEPSKSMCLMLKQAHTTFPAHRK